MQNSSVWRCADFVCVGSIDFRFEILDLRFWIRLMQKCSVWRCADLVCVGSIDFRFEILDETNAKMFSLALRRLGLCRIDF